MVELAQVDQLVVSERFVSLQGEGATAGRPCAFLRLGHCNLSCSWCDTPYTWDRQRFDLDQELQPVSFTELCQWLLEQPVNRLIITGGEPLIQHRKLEVWLQQLDLAVAEIGRERFIIEVETNGTILANASLLARVDQWNVSPKLKSSAQKDSSALKVGVLRHYKIQPRAFLKLVISDKRDEEQADALIKELEWPKTRVIFMPEARNKEELRERSPKIAKVALDNGVLFSSRLHLELYDGRRGT